MGRTPFSVSSLALTITMKRIAGSPSRVGNGGRPPAGSTRSTDTSNEPRPDRHDSTRSFRGPPRHARGAAAERGSHRPGTPADPPWSRARHPTGWATCPPTPAEGPPGRGGSRRSLGDPPGRRPPSGREELQVRGAQGTRSSGRAGSPTRRHVDASTCRHVPQNARTGWRTRVASTRTSFSPGGTPSPHGLDAARKHTWVAPVGVTGPSTRSGRRRSPRRGPTRRRRSTAPSAARRPRR